MPTDAFIVSAARGTDAAGSLRQALELAGVEPRRMQDVVFGLPASARGRNLEAIVRLAGLDCPVAAASPILRALFFAAEAILGEDADLLLAAALEGRSTTAFVLASPDAVGLLNLLPRARLAVRCVAGRDAALRAAGLTIDDVEICKEGPRLSLLHGLLEELE